jgi:tRNA (guanine-N7-)-methyltransferase
VVADPIPRKRTIRSFVRRAGRMTASQEKALAELWPVYGIDYSGSPLDFDAIFGRSADRVLEIGFGNGESLVQAAAAQPELDYVGIEVHEPGVGHCMIRAREAGIANLRIIVHDAIDVLRYQVGDGALARINLLFPDPWPKKRHHKRRIVQPGFLSLAAAKLAAGGELYIATDWENYAEHIDETLAACPEFRLDERREHVGDRPLDRRTTKFETRGLRKGHRIWDWRFIRK